MGVRTTLKNTIQIFSFFLFIKKQEQKIEQTKQNLCFYLN